MLFLKLEGVSPHCCLQKKKKPHGFRESLLCTNQHVFIFLHVLFHSWMLYKGPINLLCIVYWTPEGKVL